MIIQKQEALMVTATVKAETKKFASRVLRVRVDP